jgi:hypothetical protein
MTGGPTTDRGSPITTVGLYPARMRRILVIAAVVMFSTSACSGDDQAEPAPAITSAAAPPSAAAGAGPSTNVATDTACRLVDEATRGEFADGLEDRATIEAIVLAATKSNIESIKLAGVQMDGRYSAWSRAENGDGDYGTAVDELADAAGRLKTACVDAGVN